MKDIKYGNLVKLAILITIGIIVVFKVKYIIESNIQEKESNEVIAITEQTNREKQYYSLEKATYRTNVSNDEMFYGVWQVTNILNVEVESYREHKELRMKEIWLGSVIELGKEKVVIKDQVTTTRPNYKIYTWENDTEKYYKTFQYEIDLEITSTKAMYIEIDMTEDESWVSPGDYWLIDENTMVAAINSDLLLLKRMSLEDIEAQKSYYQYGVCDYTNDNTNSMFWGEWKIRRIIDYQAPISNLYSIGTIIKLQSNLFQIGNEVLSDEPKYEIWKCKSEKKKYYRKQFSYVPLQPTGDIAARMWSLQDIRAKRDNYMYFYYYINDNVIVGVDKNDNYYELERITSTTTAPTLEESKPLDTNKYFDINEAAYKLDVSVHETYDLNDANCRIKVSENEKFYGYWQVEEFHRIIFEKGSAKEIYLPEQWIGRVIEISKDKLIVRDEVETNEPMYKVYTWEEGGKYYINDDYGIDLKVTGTNAMYVEVKDMGGKEGIYPNKYWMINDNTLVAAIDLDLIILKRKSTEELNKQDKFYKYESKECIKGKHENLFWGKWQINNIFNETESSGSLFSVGTNIDIQADKFQIDDKIISKSPFYDTWCWKTEKNTYYRKKASLIPIQPTEDKAVVMRAMQEYNGNGLMNNNMIFFFYINEKLIIGADTNDILYELRKTE